MKGLSRALSFSAVVFLCLQVCNCAKINTPRVLLPWFENLYVNFTFEIIEGGCYSWSLSRDDIIDLEPLYEDSWGHCSRAARVSVSKSCAPPGSVIILAEEVNSGEILRGDVDIDIIRSLKVVSTTWKLFVEEAPEAFEVFAYDDQGNKFSTLEGLALTWRVENLGDNIGEDPLVIFVPWRDTDYEAPKGVTELEAAGLRAYSVLFYGQAMGEVQVNVCLNHICTDFTLQIVASVVLTPATALIAPGDTLRYRVVRARAGRLTVQDVADTLYYMQVPDSDIASLQDQVSLVRGNVIGTTTVQLISGSTEVAMATLTVTQPHSIRVNLRPHNLLVRGEMFLIHCIVLDKKGHALTAGDEMLIRLSVDGEADVALVRSTENGTLTDAVAQNSGHLTITARLHSVAGRTLPTEVSGQVSAIAVDPLQIVPPELFVAWTDIIQEVPLKYRGGGDEPVVWSTSETGSHSAITLSPTGSATVRGVGELGVSVHLKKYSHVSSSGRIWSAVPEFLQVSSSGHARVNKPHHLHVALTATHDNGDLYNFHSCNCASFAVSLLEGPEPFNVTAATWVTPVEGACCVVEVRWAARGVSSVRVSRGRAGAAARVSVRAAPAVLWPAHAAALPGAQLPVLAEGESLVPSSSDPRAGTLSPRSGPPPHQHPDVQLFTFTCKRKGDTVLELSSEWGEEGGVGGEREVVHVPAACASHVARVRLDPAAPPACSGPRVWLRPGQEVMVKVALFDAVGRELLDEYGPKVKWEIEPKHPGIEFKATDRLFVATHPDFAPVPVPYYFYQLVLVDSSAVGWTGTLKASIPEASASIQAKVVAPLECNPMTMNIAWEGESVANIAKVTGGSGKYTVETSKGVTSNVENDVLNAVVPSPGTYDLLVTDSCVQGEKLLVEVNIEEVLSVEVSTARAVCVETCVPITVLARGVSHRTLTSGKAPEWRITGHLVVREGNLLCGVMEGQGRVRASLGGVWSHEVEVLVFPPLRIVPSSSVVPVGGRLRLRYEGGPPAHLATHTYSLAAAHRYVEVSSQGQVVGVSAGKTRVRLVATDMSSVEMASAEADVEVVPISSVRVRAATQSLLVGAPGPLWLEAAGLPVSSLQARVAWTLRDPATARLYTTHADDQLERSAVEGITVRVVPLKPGVITIDVVVRNLGQMTESHSWDSSIEILAISDIRHSVEGSPKDLAPGDRIAVAVGSTIRLNSAPRSTWMGIEDGAFQISSTGELRAIRPGYGVVVSQHRDERNNIYREMISQVEVSTPHYATAEPSSDDDDSAVRVVLRNIVGRRLLAPEANTSASVAAHRRRAVHSALGEELVVTGLEAAGSLVSFAASLGGATVTDEVWLPPLSAHSDRVLAAGSWGVCLEGSDWMSSSDVTLYPGAGVTLAVLNKDVSMKHSLRTERHHQLFHIHQLPIAKMEFKAGEWPSSLVPLSIEASSLASGPLVCSEEQKYALEGIQVTLPFKCRTKAPLTAHAVFDIMSGQIGCSIIPSAPISEASEVELCAEWEPYRACTKVLVLPLITLSKTKVSLLKPPASFTVYGSPQALKFVKITSSPGLKLALKSSAGEIDVQLNNEVTTCGIGWVNVVSKLTAQEIRVEVERECDIACGTLLGALFALIRPYVPTLMTIVAVAAAYLYIQSRLAEKSRLRLPMEPTTASVLPPATPAPRRAWASSPYPLRPSPSTPSSPVYGETSLPQDPSFSPNSTRIHSRFL